MLPLSYTLIIKNRMPGRSQVKKRERERAAACLCQTLDALLPTAKRKATGDGQQPAPLVAEANAAAAECIEIMSAKLVNWLHRIPTSRKSLRCTVLLSIHYLCFYRTWEF